MKSKIYLEPREQYDPFILEETENEIVYDGAEIVAYLIEMFRKEGADEEDADTMGIEWFYFNIDRLSDYYAISFSEESDEGYILQCLFSLFILSKSSMIGGRFDYSR